MSVLHFFTKKCYFLTLISGRKKLWCSELIRPIGPISLIGLILLAGNAVLFRHQPDRFPDPALTGGVFYPDDDVLTFPVPVDGGSDLQRERSGPVIGIFENP